MRTTPRKLRFPAPAALMAAAVFAGALVLHLPAAGATWRGATRSTFELEGAKIIRVENSRGETRVKTGGSVIDLSALKIARGATTERAERQARDTAVEVDREGDAFVVRVVHPRGGAVRLGFWDLLRGREPAWTEVRLELAIPRGLALDVRSASGDVMTAGLEGDQRIRCSSGDVSVDGARGALNVVTSSGDIDLIDVGAAELRAVSGDISVDGASGPARMRVTSGDVRVRGAHDSLEINATSGDVEIDDAPAGLLIGTSSGNVDVRAAAGDVSVTAASGDVTIGLARGLREANITTVTGNARVRLAPDLACRLDLRTSSGEIDVAVPLTLKSVSRRQVTGSVRGGKVPVVVNTSSGGIELQGGGL